MKKTLTTTLLSLTLLAGCTTDAYEKGDGQYSLIQADFVEAHANSQRMIDYVETDNNERLTVGQPFTKEWIKTADSLYRSVIFYRREGTTVNDVNISQIVTPSLICIDTLIKRKIKMRMDPINFESLWLSKNKRYLNASIYLKTGKADDTEARHTLSIVSDSVRNSKDGKKTLCLRLYHDQGDIPEHYSAQSYFSIPLKEITADSIQMTIQTYNGLITKCIGIR